MTIRFWLKHEQPYGVFSGFSPHGFEFEGRFWPTLEHAYQAQKFAGAPRAELVRCAETPRRAHALGNDPAHPPRPDWETAKHEVMLRVLLRKFEVHEDIRELLLDTGDEELVEASKVDRYWGDGGDGSGRNHYGKTLMAARAALRERAWPAETIRFYRANEEPYGVFSNFSRHPITLDGQEWPTVEHFYQAQKFVGTPHADAVRAARTAFEARKLGNDRARPVRPRWDMLREAILWRAAEAKFRAHADARDLLLATGDVRLVEASPYDAYWGSGPQGDGENRLGRILMQLRDLLRREAAGVA